MDSKISNTDRDTGDTMSGKSKEKTKKLIQGINIEQAKELRRESKLGNTNHSTHQTQKPQR